MIAALGLVLVAVAGGLIWQERRRVPEPQRAVVYGTEDAVTYVWERLGDDIRSELRRSDVRRIMEWELHYLQQPRLRERPAVVGSVEAAEYVQQRAYEQGHPYEPGPIFAVLELQAAYLVSLGAVGERVVDEPE